MTLDDFIRDETRDAMRIRSVNRRFFRQETEVLAIGNAKREHSVMSYVKGLPFEDPTYPAIMYLGFARDVNVPLSENGQEIQERDRDNGGDDRRPIQTVQQTVQESQQEHERKRNISDHTTNDPSVLRYMEWCPPAHDFERPEQKGCGFIRSKSGGLVYTACPDDHDHHCKAKSMHCWSLRCPICANDTALRRGIAIEKQLLKYRMLNLKQGADVGDIGHWVVSPTQELVKGLMQTRDGFDALSKYIEDSLQTHGAKAGVTVFHPWRQNDIEWALSPHFHSLLYGRIDTNAFRKENPGWVIKKVHPRERIRSIRHTAAYLLTHAGLGLSAEDPDEVDWDLKLLNHLIPGILSEGASYNENDYSQLSDGKGRMSGDLSDIDWTEWVKEELTKETRLRYWGGASIKSFRQIGNYRQYKIRVCRECGAVLRTYDGYDDRKGSYVRYIQDNAVVCFAKDRELVDSEYLRFKDRMREEGLNIADFARMTPHAISTLELGLEKNDDLIMDGPFDEPDEFFLKRQERAFAMHTAAAVTDAA